MDSLISFSKNNDECRSSDDDECLAVLVGSSKQKSENFLELIVPYFDEKLFTEHFRISRKIAEKIAWYFKRSQYCKHHSGVNGKISPFSQVLVFLWFIGHKSPFRDVAKRFDITNASVHRIIKRVGTFISRLSPQIIKWPTREEKVEIEKHFKENGLPLAFGSIDTCYIKIDKPSDNPKSYMKNGKYALSLQLVCDHSHKIRDIFVGYPHSINKSFNMCPLSKTLEEKCGNYYLLGNSSYPLKKNLMIPYKNISDATDAQLKFNNIFLKNKYASDRCFTVLNERFPGLFYIKLRDIELMITIIRATCVLYNISLNNDFKIYDASEEEDGDPDDSFLNVCLDENDDFDCDMDDNVAEIMRDIITSNIKWK